MKAAVKQIQALTGNLNIAAVEALIDSLIRDNMSDQRAFVVEQLEAVASELEAGTNNEIAACLKMAAEEAAKRGTWTV